MTLTPEERLKEIEEEARFCRIGSDGDGVDMFGWDSLMWLIATVREARAEVKSLQELRDGLLEDAGTQEGMIEKAERERDELRAAIGEAASLLNLDSQIAFNAYASKASEVLDNALIPKPPK